MILDLAMEELGAGGACLCAGTATLGNIMMEKYCALSLMVFGPSWHLTKEQKIYIVEDIVL
jgi:hypothetical protein